MLFRHELAAAAALWGMMAFGDPAASIVGKRLGGPRLPWNRRKTAAGFLAYAVVGAVAAGALWIWVWVRSAPFGPPPWRTFFEAAVVLLPITTFGACLESLDTGLDDNWVPPLPCAAMMAWLMAGGYGFWGAFAVDWKIALAVNAGVALAMLGARLVSPSGAVAGAGLGFVILAAAGWRGYAILWTFFLVATIATKLGYGRKQTAGTAQAESGRRGARHALANCGVGAALAVVALAISSSGGGLRNAILFGFVGAFAAALADTLGTELGSLYGRRPVSLAARKPVPPGTSGAVSGAGIAGGLAGGALIGAVAALVGLVPWSAASIGAVAGAAGSLAESLLADAARLRGGRIEHDFANAFNTFVGAAVAAEIAASLELGRLYLPFEFRG
jgi:uncharacterized protein (TIGR00297 family)